MNAILAILDFLVVLYVVMNVSSSPCPRSNSSFFMCSLFWPMTGRWASDNLAKLGA